MPASAGCAYHRAVLAPLLWVLAAFAAPSPAPSPAPNPARSAPSRVDERVPLIAVVIAPGGTRAHLPVSTVLDATAHALEPVSGLRVLSPEQAGADPAAFVRCPPARRLSCWIRTARAGESGARARFVLVISVLARDGEPDRLSAQLLDVEAAADAVRGDPTPDEAEDLVQIHATHGTVGATLVDSRAALDRWLRALVEDVLRGPLEARGEWAPFGGLRVTTDRPLVAELDGRSLGALDAGVTTLAEVRAGPRVLTLRDPASDPPLTVTHRVAVERGAEAAVVVVMPSSIAPVARVVSTWSGLATTAAGAGLVVWALAAAPSSRALAPCSGAGCEGPQPARWDDPCTLTRADPATCGAQRGLRVAPLGGALILAGTSWAVGGALGDPDQVPWIAWLAGVAAGALAYGIAVAVE